MKNIRVFAYTGLLAMAALLAGCSTEATRGAKQLQKLQKEIGTDA